MLGPFSLKEWAIYLVLFGFALQAYTAIKRKLVSDKATGNLMKSKCLGCGWSGKVSKHHRSCPKCGNVITRVK